MLANKYIFLDKELSTITGVYSWKRQTIQQQKLVKQYKSKFTVAVSKIVVEDVILTESERGRARAHIL